MTHSKQDKRKVKKAALFQQVKKAALFMQMALLRDAQNVNLNINRIVLWNIAQIS